MRLSELNRRPKSDDPKKESILLRIASDIAISIMPFEDADREKIIKTALQFAESGNNIRELYRAAEEEFEK